MEIIIEREREREREGNSNYAYTRYVYKNTYKNHGIT